MNVHVKLRHVWLFSHEYCDGAFRVYVFASESLAQEYMNLMKAAGARGTMRIEKEPVYYA